MPQSTPNPQAIPSRPPTSLNAILSQPLRDIQSLSLSLFQSLSPTQSKPPPTPPISSFLACDADLANATRLARIHQNKQRRIEKLKTEVLELEQSWRDICMELESGKRELEVLIEEGEVRCKAIEEAKRSSIPYPELLTYAQSLSAFTSAPPNMPDLSLPGQPPPPLFFPPFPNEEKMRRGRLNTEAPLGLLGETHSVGRAPTASPKVGDDAPPAASNNYRQDNRPQQQIFDLDLDLNPDL